MAAFGINESPIRSAILATVFDIEGAIIINSNWPNCIWSAKNN